MTRNVQVARDQLITSLAIALTVWPRHLRQNYARITSRRAEKSSTDKMEMIAIRDAAKTLARRFAPFALIQHGAAHHWSAAIPAIEQALTALPINARQTLAERSSRSTPDVARNIFDAVDNAFTLIPLPPLPEQMGGPTWEEVFEQEYGVETNRKVAG